MKFRLRLKQQNLPAPIYPQGPFSRSRVGGAGSALTCRTSGRIATCSISCFCATSRCATSRPPSASPGRCCSRSLRWWCSPLSSAGLAGVPSDGQPYPIFVFAGLLPWSFFNQAVTNSSNSLVGNAGLITKVYFPRLVIPAAAVGAGLVDFAIAAVILFVMALYYGVRFSLSGLMLIPLALLTTLFATAVGMWMSALNVKYRDVRYALPFALQIWMYVTPIIYPVSFIPARWRWLIGLNPLSGIIQGFRSAIFGRPFDWLAIGLSTVMTLGVLLCALFEFRRMEREFADLI